MPKIILEFFISPKKRAVTAHVRKAKASSKTRNKDFLYIFWNIVKIFSTAYSLKTKYVI